MLGSALLGRAMALAYSGRLTVRETADAARRAAAAAPNDPPVWLESGLFVTAVDPAGGAGLAAQAAERDPLDPIVGAAYGMMLAYAGRVGDAERVQRQAVALGGDVGFIHAMLGETLLREGHAADALAEFQRGIAGGDRDMSLAGAGVALAQLGRTAEARQYLARIEQASRSRYVIGDWVAKLCLALGDRAGALSWLERAADAGSTWTRFVDVDPAYAPLRGDPRFDAVRRRIGLGPAPLAQ
jgi:serine/threonine-protein kinase